MCNNLPASIEFSLHPAAAADAANKRAFLTFDDGPSNESSGAAVTHAIIEKLSAYGRYFKTATFPATFFCLGSYVERNPDVVNRANREGHYVANHSWDHPDFIKKTDAEIIDQITRTNQQIATATGGFQSRYVRAPYGSADDRVQKVIRDLGLTLVGWNVDTTDWQAKTIEDAHIRVPFIVDKFWAALTAAEANPQSMVILFHDGPDGRDSTLQALDFIVPALHFRGYTCCTIDQL